MHAYEDGYVFGSLPERADESGPDVQESKLDSLSRAIVTTLNEPYEEANRRAWANITRPVES